MANAPTADAHSAARHFIPRIWHVDPLGCPVCQNPMRVIAAIDDPRVVEKTLRHLARTHLGTTATQSAETRDPKLEARNKPQAPSRE